MLLSKIDLKYFSQRLLDFANDIPDDVKEFVDGYFFASLCDSGQEGDCILTLGSKNGLKYRVPTAISLFNAERAPFIMATGGNIYSDNLTEAEIYKKHFLLGNIPEEAIITECFSKNTPENIMFSKKVLSEKFGDRNLIVILVTNAFHMRRALLTAEKYFPSGYRIITSPVIDTNTRADNWHTTEKGRARMEKELRSLVVSIKNNWAVDDEIDAFLKIGK